MVVLPRPPHRAGRLARLRLRRALPAAGAFGHGETLSPRAPLLQIGGEKLAHVHAGNGKHVYYTAGEPHAAATVLDHRHPKRDDYFERALMEVIKKKHLPRPTSSPTARSRSPPTAWPSTATAST